MRTYLILLTCILALAGCEPTAPSVGKDGKPLQQRYNITTRAAARIPYTVLDSVNSLRRAAGVPLVALNSQLTAAAATHSRDMSLQNRPWHFGSDGSSPMERVHRVGYTGQLTGENISETYETEGETLAAWMNDVGTRRVILDPQARDIGVAWFQEKNGKIWWTLTMGTRELSAPELSAPAES